MQVVDGLPSVNATVRDDAVAILQAQKICDLGYFAHHVAKDLGVAI